MTSSSGLKLLAEHLLNLFDVDLSPADQLAAIHTFLNENDGVLDKTTGPSDLLLYYVGHGLFASDGAYCLAIRATNESHVGSSSLRGRELADVLNRGAAFIRRYLVVDCCFAASLANMFQGGPADVLIGQALNDFPARGVSLLCASSKLTAAYLSSASQYTTFTDALLRALTNGNDSLGRLMSLQELGNLTRQIIKMEVSGIRSRPEVHTPIQRDGDISFFPFFPNPAFSDDYSSKRTQVAKTPAKPDTAVEIDAANRSMARDAVLGAVKQVLTKYRSVKGLHVSPTIPKDELAQASVLASVPRNATVLGLGVVHIYFKLAQFGRVLDSFILFTETGVYLHNTWNKKASTAYIAYPNLWCYTIALTSQSYHVSRVGAYTHSTLRVGPHSIHVGDFGDDRRNMEIGDVERLLSEIQLVLKS